MRILVYAIIALVVLQRLAELPYAARNTAALKRRGGIEVGRAHYPLLVLLHTAWLATIVLALPLDAHVNWIALSVFIVLQGFRVWIIASLGPYWTTRIITLPDAPLVRRGPYRYVRHPNYMLVAAEIAVFPLVFGEVTVAIVFSVLNGLVLAWRIRQEDKALAVRRALPDMGMPAAKG
jgi:methyltransferase